MLRARTLAIAFAVAFAGLVYLGGSAALDAGGAKKEGKKETKKGPSKVASTPLENIKAAKDFKVEMLYTVPADKQGSWVAMCPDPKGRLYVSDQYGGLYRVTPPPIGTDKGIEIEQLNLPIGEAQGLLWAFDSLYVMVNRGAKVKSGLYRLTDTDGDDKLDKVEHLRALTDGGEHGPHAVVLSPDGKSLYCLHGNHTNLTEISSTKAPKVWRDYDGTLLPQMWDANGHAVGRQPPGGCIYRVSPDGKEWELISIGYRNQYDMAFSRDGELFTYDSDMEWDVNTPWYRPTRICHAVPGSEFGWRGGTGKMYEYHPDNLPPVVNVGPGSPTGVTFGYGAKFPAKYQDAFFACDWSYGRLYAMHLKPDGASYKGELEEFVTGSPLALTDLCVNPKDGALYFALGGRRTASGLYRVTYVGKESTEPSKGSVESAGSEARAIRKKLEAFYGKQDPAAVEAAWPYLSNEDRFLRYAARTVLEFQDPKTWQEKALAEKNPVALTHALIGLARVGEKSLLPKMLSALETVDWNKLTLPQRIDYLRAYQLAFLRMGKPEGEMKDSVAKRIDSFYPSNARETNAELSKLVCFLETPKAVAATLALIAKAPSQEEQMEYALSLRVVKHGWTESQRKEYFDWFHKAAGYKGGNSFHGFLRNIRAEAIKSLNPQEQVALKEVLAVLPQPNSPKFTTKPRPVVKKYTVEELIPVVEKGINAGGRDFDKARNLFGEAKCFSCHRFGNEGGGTGPDLTVLANRFSVKDMLESIILPSKVISDQYQAVVVTTKDDRIVTGRIVNLAGNNVMVNTDPFNPNGIVQVDRNNIDTITPSKTSIMPEGLIDSLQEDEIVDLIAYLFARGDRGHKAFRK
ncbi:MAG: c-type cytochrome [Gemmataceae bacterium]|nr:c-type cytochrome [Gemmataceae bacterium]